MEGGRSMRQHVLATLAISMAVASGCDPNARDAVPVAEERSVAAPSTVAYELPPRLAALDADPAPSTGVPAAPNVSVDARILVVTATGSSGALDAIHQILGFLGTPHDILDATSGPTLTADFLATDDHGKYQAIFLDLDDLSVSGASAFSDDEWKVLSAYEAKFSVRRVALYGTGTAAYGLTHAGAAIDTAAMPLPTHCTDAGTDLLVGANCAAPVVIGAGWAYPASAADGDTTPLLVDDAGHVYAAVRTYPDGREALALTFAQSPVATHTLELGYALVRWATRGVFLGQRQVVLAPQLDDLFLASAIYPRTGETYRITDADLQSFADWQAARRASDPRLADLRIAFAANGYGARAGTQDPLVAKAVDLASAFAWINHTWDHVYMDTMSYATALDEFTHNDQALRALPLTPYDSTNAVTPGVTGLGNADAMKAAYDAGIRYLVSDSSYPAQKNPSPNAGLWNALVPEILELPRTPTEIGYDDAVPADLVAEYNARNAKAFTYEQIIAAESLTLSRYLLLGNTNPLMFHQANIRDIGGGRSLLADVLGATLDRYLAASSFPVESPTMDELGRRAADRMAYDGAGATATIEDGSRLTVQVANAARVPVTGLCTPDARTFGGETISYVDLAAGGSASFSLSDCNDLTGAVGATGRGMATNGAMAPEGAPPHPSSGCSVSPAAGGGSGGQAMVWTVFLALGPLVGRCRRRRRHPDYPAPSLPQVRP
jgi:hypothetical protein